MGYTMKAMNTSSFDDFVKRQQGGSFDWTKERDEWLRNLESLYKQVESFLSQYVTSGEINLRYRAVTLNEEHIGSYEAKQLIISIGRSEIHLEPIGTFIIGAKGRVDIVGPNGRAQLLLVDKKAENTRSLIRVTVTLGEKAPVPAPQPAEPVEYAWKCLTRPPARDLLDLTRESFHQLLMEVSNG